MSRIKLAYCTPSLHTPGGVERVLTTKVNYLADVLGYEVTIILTDGGDREPAYPLSPRVKVINLDIGFEELWRLSFLRKIPVYLRKQRIFRRRMEETLGQLKPDITISTLRREVNFITSLKDGSLKMGELHVCRKHYRNFEEGDTNFLKEAFARLWMRSLIRKLKRLERFVVLTEEDRRCWPELQNALVISNPSYFKTEGQADYHAHRVIAAGRFVYQKGFDRLIEAWAKVCGRFPDWELHIYGSGDKQAYRTMATQAGAERIFLEEPTRQIMQRYQESSIYALSSRFEGMPMVLLEVMTCGLPPVAFGCPCGPKDLIQPGRNGLLAEDGNTDDLAEKLATLMADEDLRRRLGQQAAIDVHRYDVDVIMKQWDELFRTLVAHKKRGYAETTVQ
jgi:glycosyltransferase involved in cell wall biosynthesis